MDLMKENSNYPKTGQFEMKEKNLQFIKDSLAQRICNNFLMLINVYTMLMD